MRAISTALVTLGAAATLLACGPTPPAGGTGGTGGTGGGNTSDHPCETKASQTVVIGDSYINWGTHTLPADLAREAGETWRMYAVGGASMATGGITTLIPDQFNQALAADRNILTVVMDGGGNDVLIPAASWPNGTACKNGAIDGSCPQIVQAALDKGKQVMQTAANAGVRDAVYFFYPHVPTGTLIGGTNPNNILDYALPKVKALCDDAVNATGGKLRCHFVDMIPVFQGHPEYFAAGDIHENSQGSAAMARAIVGRMKTDCVSQHSGCCQ
jgi:hypothetical protein